MAFHIQQYDNDGAMTAQQQFSKTSVKELYDAYLRKVEEWADLEPDVTLKLRERWYWCAVYGLLSSMIFDMSLYSSTSITSRFGGASVTVVKGMSNEEKQRAQMALAGRCIDVDAYRSDASDVSQNL